MVPWTGSPLVLGLPHNGSEVGVTHFSELAGKGPREIGGSEDLLFVKALPIQNRPGPSGFGICNAEEDRGVT